ncbi:MAG: histidine phosphatase family protein [Candidatus Uhrbacteria bacterium]
MSFEKPRGEVELSKEIEPKIVLHFFRHSEKAPGKPDERIRLSPRGRELAKQKAAETNLSQAVAFGSSRDRTHETALLVMAGQNNEITGNETLEELKEKLKLPYGSKIGLDDRLNFFRDDLSTFGKAALEAFVKGYYLKFMVEQSDRLAGDLDDKVNSTYNRQAANVAEVILKYVGFIPQWKEILNDPDSIKKYSSDIMERFMGSHQGVLESFLARAIEITEGVDRRNEFVTALDNQGFDYVEGFNVEISQNEPIIHLSYSRPRPDGNPFVFNQALTRSQLESIAALK